jgi:hypothetical protein
MSTGDAGKVKRSSPAPPCTALPVQLQTSTRFPTHGCSSSAGQTAAAVCQGSEDLWTLADASDVICATQYQFRKRCDTPTETGVAPHLLVGWTAQLGAAAAAAVLLLLVVMPVSTMLPGLTGNSAWNNGCHRGSVEALCLKAVQVQVSAARGRAWGGEAHRP